MMNNCLCVFKSRNRVAEVRGRRRKGRKKRGKRRKKTSRRRRKRKRGHLLPQEDGSQQNGS